MPKFSTFQLNFRVLDQDVPEMKIENKRAITLRRIAVAARKAEMQEEKRREREERRIEKDLRRIEKQAERQATIQAKIQAKKIAAAAKQNKQQQNAEVTSAQLKRKFKAKLTAQSKMQKVNNSCKDDIDVKRAMNAARVRKHRAKKKTQQQVLDGAHIDAVSEAAVVLSIQPSELSCNHPQSEIEYLRQQFPNEEFKEDEEISWIPEERRLQTEQRLIPYRLETQCNISHSITEGSIGNTDNIAVEN